MEIIPRHASFILLAFLSFASTNVGWANSCDTCSKLERALADFAAKKSGLQELLARNRVALSDSGESSRRIKVTSNIFMITMELETIENQEQRVRAYVAKIGCPACAKRPGT